MRVPVACSIACAMAGLLPAVRGGAEETRESRDRLFFAGGRLEGFHSPGHERKPYSTTEGAGGGLVLAGEFGVAAKRWLHVGATAGASLNATNGGDACWYTDGSGCYERFAYLAGFVEVRPPRDWVVAPRARLAGGGALMFLTNTIRRPPDTVVAAYLAPEIGVDVVLDTVSFGPYFGYRVFGAHNDPAYFGGIRVSFAF